MRGLNYLIIALTGALLFIPLLGQVHLFDWDEINFAESAREMLLTRNYSQVQIDFRPFWEKPPLFIWLQALSMNFFGVNEFTARLPNALIGIATLLTLYHIGAKRIGTRFGWTWVLVYAGSILPHLYFKSGIIDPLFNFFIFLGIYQLSNAAMAYEAANNRRHLAGSLLAGLFIGLGILTKGPVALLMAMLSMLVYFVVRGFKPYMRFTSLFLFFIVAGIVSFAWFGMETIRNGPWFIVTFIEYQIRLLTTQDAGHGGPFYYHFIVLLLGVFPASVFTWSTKSQEKNIEVLRSWMVILLTVVVVVFSIVETKIVHYSSLAYFPLTFIAAFFIEKVVFEKKLRPNLLQRILAGAIGSVFAFALILLPYVGANLDKFKSLIVDPFAQAAMQADVTWSGNESFIGWFYLVMIIASLVLLRKPHTARSGIVTLFAATIVFVQLTLYIIVPKIEGYSQRAAIEFYKAQSGKDVYVSVLGFKSYAHLFYFEKPIPADTIQRDLLYGYLDKPVLFVAKIDKAEQLEKDYPIERIGEKNGFVFFRRK